MKEKQKQKQKQKEDNNKLIYVVDDRPDNIKLLTHYLNSEEYLVEAFLSGETVLDQLSANHLNQRRQPDLILLDLMMPGLSGMEVIQRIKADKKLSYIPIIMLTAYGSTETRVISLESGADDFLRKPINRAELVARVDSLVRLKQAYDHKDALLRQLQTTHATLHNTQLKLLEAEKHTLQMNTMLATAGGICHEMSQPLTSVFLTLESLREGLVGSSKHREDVEIIRNDILKVREILDKLRSLTRYETKPYLGDDVILDIDQSSR
jgi:DNA-binding response OmpR family regulator